MNASDRQLRAGLIRIASTLPKGDAGRKQILSTIASFDAGTIGEKVPGPVDGVPGSEQAQLKGEFTQQENSELREKKESGKMASEKKVAGAKLVRRLVTAKVAATLSQGTRLQGRMLVNLQTKSEVESVNLPIRFLATLDNGKVSDFTTIPAVAGSGAIALLVFYREIVQEAVDMGLVGSGAEAVDLMI